MSSTVHILATSREGLRAAPTNNSGRCRRWTCAPESIRTQQCCSTSGPSAVAPEISLSADDERRRRRRDLPPPRWNPVGDRVGRITMLSMTVTRCAIASTTGSGCWSGRRRGLERHQTLRHAVQWSYDLLDDAEKHLLNRCSVFAGGFDLASAMRGHRRRRRVRHPGSARCAWCASHFWSPTDRQAGRDSRCWRPSANSPKNNSWLRMRPTTSAPRTPATSRDGKPTCSPSGTVHDNASPTTGSPSSWRILRAAFRWAADHDDLDSAAAIAVSASILGFWVEQYEPSAWAEEIIEPARAVEHRRLAQLYVGGRAVLRGQSARRGSRLRRGRPATRSRVDATTQCRLRSASELGGVYTLKGEPHRWIEMCRNTIAREHGCAHLDPGVPGGDAGNDRRHG